MTDPHDSPSDELLDELLAPFRTISVPDEVRISNRDRVRVALAICPPCLVATHSGDSGSDRDCRNISICHC